MKNLERLKLYLNNKAYYKDSDYVQFLEENGLDAYDDYEVDNDKRHMLETVYDILSNLANDIDYFRKIETEFITTTAAYQYLQKRLKDLRDDIDRTIDEEKSEGSDRITSFLFYNRTF